MSQARILTSREYRKVLIYISSHRHASRNKAILYASHLAGLRVGEISHLTISDVLNEDGTIKDEVYLCADKTKGDRGRTVLIPQKLQEELHNYLSIRFRLKDLKSVSMTDTSKALFYSQRHPSDGFSPNTLAQYFHYLYKNAGIEGASSHSGRRFFATKIAEAGTNPKVLQNLLGHRNLQTTMRYVEISPTMMRNAVELMS
jgi:integrase/recombinase XerD